MDWIWSLIVALVGVVLGWLGASVFLLDCRKDQWQFRDDLRKTRDELSKIATMLGSKTHEEKESPKIPDRSEGRPGPKHRTMWGDV